jgi:thiol:disulfide interchange protein DsbA
VKRIPILFLALFALAGCGQPEPTSTAAEQATGTAETMSAPATAPATAAETTAAPAPAVAATATEATAQAESAATTESPATERIQLAQVDLSSVEAAGFVEGQHYRRLSPTQPSNSSPGTVEVAEFFMHSCIHCYNLEPYVEAWLPEKPEHIQFVRVPTTWNPTVRLHAQGFYTAVALGKEEEMNMPFFREMHDRGNYLQSADALADFFGEFDVSREEFEGVFDSFAVHTRLNRADELGRRYRVDSTPTIIVNGKYRTDVGMAGGYDQLFALIEALAAAELGL